MSLGELARLLSSSPELREALELHALLAARVLPLAAIGPLLGLSRVPPALRFTAALALVLGLAPAAGAPERAFGAGALLAEALSGAFFTAIAALPLVAFSTAGRLIDQARGVSHPGERETVEGEPASAMGHLHAMAGLALFFGLGGHVFVLRAFAEGLEALPLGALSLSREALFGFVGLADKALLFGAGLALPAFAAVLLVEGFMGLVARTAQTLPVFHAGMPLRALAGLLAAALTLSLGLTALRGELGHALGAALAWLSAGR